MGINFSQLTKLCFHFPRVCAILRVFVHIGGIGMKKKLLFALVLLLMAAALPISASAELGIKPVADPWTIRIIS